MNTHTQSMRKRFAGCRGCRDDDDDVHVGVGGGATGRSGGQLLSTGLLLRLTAASTTGTTGAADGNNSRISYSCFVPSFQESGAGKSE